MSTLAAALSAALQRCIATKEVALNHQPVGFMYREAPVFEHDSGWRFFSGEESDEYTDNPDNFFLCDVSDILADNPEISDYLQEKSGAWEWLEDGFASVNDWQPQD